jgi:hypothetical protein
MRDPMTRWRFDQTGFASPIAVCARVGAHAARTL